MQKGYCINKTCIPDELQSGIYPLPETCPDYRVCTKMQALNTESMWKFDADIRGDAINFNRRAATPQSQRWQGDHWHRTFAGCIQ